MLAHWLLQEKLNVFGVLGCLLCIVGSLVIVLHAPEVSYTLCTADCALLAALLPPANASLYTFVGSSNTLSHNLKILGQQLLVAQLWVRMDCRSDKWALC